MITKEIEQTVESVTDYIFELAKKPVEELNPLEIQILELASSIIKMEKEK